MSVNEIDFPIIFLSTGSFVKYFPKNKAKANKIFIIPLVLHREKLDH